MDFNETDDKLYSTWPAMAPKILDYARRICPDYEATLNIVDMTGEDGDDEDRDDEDGDDEDGGDEDGDPMMNKEAKELSRGKF